MTISAAKRQTCTEGTFAVAIELEDAPNESSTNWLRYRFLKKVLPGGLDPNYSPPLQVRKIDWVQPDQAEKGALCVSPVPFLKPSSEFHADGGIISPQLSKGPLQTTKDSAQNTSPVLLDPKPPVTESSVMHPAEDLQSFPKTVESLNVAVDSTNERLITQIVLEFVLDC